MASNEIYELRIRFESDNTSFMNILHFKQGLDAPAGKTGATFLLEAAVFPSSIVTFFTSKMTTQVRVVCMEAVKVIPEGSGQVPEYNVTFLASEFGDVAEDSLPIDSTLVYQVVGLDSIAGKRPPQSYIYVSGVPESWTEGPWVSADVSANLSLTDDNLLSVPSSEGSGAFRIGVLSPNSADGFFTVCNFIDPPCFPSKRNTRKRSLC